MLRAGLGSFCGSLVLASALFCQSAVAAEPTLQPSAVEQMNALHAVKEALTPTQKKIGSRVMLAILKNRRDSRLDALTSFRYLPTAADGTLEIDVMVKPNGSVKAVIDEINRLGGSVRTFNYHYRTVRGFLKLADIETLAGKNDVLRVREGMKGYTHREPAPTTTGDLKESIVAKSRLARTKALGKAIRGGINVSEGVIAHRADEAHASFGATGAGVKICVLSDGVDSLAALQASGDLPAGIDVLAGQAGSGDEGSAMLEIVHDMAPAADLGFATAFPDITTFAQNILDLRNVANCDIIVDDIIYFAESPFQDSVVAAAVDTVVADGAMFFSSAGNEGNLNDLSSGTWEGDFNPNGTPPALAGGGIAHNFGDGGQSQLLTAGSVVNMMHWTDVAGLSANDYDLYVLDGTLATIFDASTDVQDGAGGDDFPFEIFGQSFTGERLVAMQFAGANRMLSVSAFRGVVTNQTTGCTRGHNSAVGAFGVAAVDATAPGGDFTVANPVENFSCDGPRRIFFDSTGALLPGAPAGDFSATGGVIRNKPDIAAADGVATAAPGFNPFFGTSAAAPHAAAIAGLIKQIFPAMTNTQIGNAMKASALDIEAAGADRDSGSGIVMAFETLQALGAPVVATLDKGAEVATQVAGDGDAFIEPNEDWSFSIPLTNIGAGGATAISAVLSTTTPGLTVALANAQYNDLAPTVSGNNLTPFVFSVGGTVACGAVADFTLTVSYTGGVAPTQTFNFSAVLGAPGAAQSFSYAGAALPIPDALDLSGTMPGAVVSAPVNVAAVVGNVLDVNVSIDGTVCSATAGSTTVGIDHSFVNDLQIALRSPTGTSVMVIQNTDGGGNNLCQTVLDDESAGANIQTVVSANAPFTGSFTPNAALSGFDGESANGTWNLDVQDFFSADTGSIRAYTVTITPAVCDAPVQAPSLTAVKSVTGGTQIAGGTVTYDVVLTNAGPGVLVDNPGDEFTDTLPAGLTAGTPTATTGTVSGAGVNPVTWNGSLLPGGSVTITIPATIAAGTGGTTISNQGTATFDANRDGTNDTPVLTDAPGGGADEPTDFLVGFPPAPLLTASKAATSGNWVAGGTLVYTIVITNSGTAAQADLAGAEFTDTLPAGLLVGTPTATSGTISGAGVNPVTWNGALNVGESVTITIPTTIDLSLGGQTVSNQGILAFDGNGNGVNDVPGVTDQPGGGIDEPTLVFIRGEIVPVPVDSRWLLLTMVLGLLLIGLPAASRRLQ